jgi:putative lipoic acid-binding regulatory protein|tara:strand:- start:8 stop:292 length:285 start_codon:yes stop_codon:yes gene_type:complete
MVNEREAFYAKLKIQLGETSKFPSDYMYKFIVPTTGNQVQEVRDLFSDANAEIKLKKSKTGKYESLSIVLKVKNPSEIISYYKKAEKIKGIISL